MKLQPDLEGQHRVAIEELREEQCESRFRFLALDVFFRVAVVGSHFGYGLRQGKGWQGFSRMGSAVVFSRS